jgi:hypothetical protein
MALPASPLSQSISKMTVTMQAATKTVHSTPLLMKHVELSNERWLKITVDRKRDRAVMF